MVSPNMLRNILLLTATTTRISDAFIAPYTNGVSPAPTYVAKRNVHQSLFRFLPTLSSTDGATDKGSGKSEIDVASDDRLYTVRLSRASGIEWGTDLSFSFVYVREMDPTGAAALSGAVQVGDQLCQSTPVMNASDNDSVAAPTNLVGAPFDFVMGAFATLDRSVQELDLVFFRGTKEELRAACTGQSDGARAAPETITVTVVQRSAKRKGDSIDDKVGDEATVKLTAPIGTNIRQLLVDNNINVYQSVTRWTNCKGKQLCGTCIVNVAKGALGTNRKSMDEASTLRENPDSYRLSCVTFAYDDVTVETFPPVEASQWTR